MNDAVEKARKDQVATGRFLLWYCILYTVACVGLGAYVFLVVIPSL
ncbi:MAG: hypothetical protein WCI30_03510 [Clostridia bacterium]